MSQAPQSSFVLLDSRHGKLIANRHETPTAHCLFTTGALPFELELQGLIGIVDILPNASVIIEGGAHCGFYSIPMAARIKPRGGQVHAFEVQRMLTYALGGAAALNDLENVFVHHHALGREREEILVPVPDYAVAQSLGRTSLKRPLPADFAYHPEGTAEPISVTTIDGLGLARLDFVKLDIQGMEVDALAGGQRMIKTYRPWCWVRCEGQATDAIKEQFVGLAYRFFVIGEDSVLCAPTERIATSNAVINAPEI